MFKQGEPVGSDVAQEPLCCRTKAASCTPPPGTCDSAHPRDARACAAYKIGRGQPRPDFSRQKRRSAGRFRPNVRKCGTEGPPLMHHGAQRMQQGGLRRSNPASETFCAEMMTGSHKSSRRASIKENQASARCVVGMPRSATAKSQDVGAVVRGRRASRLARDKDGNK
jgi:hypothetical protein